MCGQTCGQECGQENRADNIWSPPAGTPEKLDGASPQCNTRCQASIAHPVNDDDSD